MAKLLVLAPVALPGLTLLLLAAVADTTLPPGLLQSFDVVTAVSWMVSSSVAITLEADDRVAAVKAEFLVITHCDLC